MHLLLLLLGELQEQDLEVHTGTLGSNFKNASKTTKILNFDYFLIQFDKGYGN